METLKYNYFYCGVAIPKSNWIQVAPDNWENELNEFGEFSYGYYKIILREN